MIENRLKRTEKSTETKFVDSLLYRNNLKNREFDKEAAQFFASGVSDHCQGPRREQTKKNAAKPTSSKTDSSGCFGIFQKIDINERNIVKHSC
ncbi:MAG TPA: hypothetical protein VLE95_01020 [Chlamydiales bacterium]|nr:hypothetical protein [Chlamydiales bacterium]